jgi:hypothetical protein
VCHYCGTKTYSSFQVKFVFEQRANFPFGDKGDVTKGTIPVTVFKDYFYPGKVWRPEYMTAIERKKANELKEGPASIQSESLRFSQIMDGRFEANASSKQNDKKTVDHRGKKDEDQSILDEHDSESVQSVRFADLLSLRNPDPRELKEK